MTTAQQTVLSSLTREPQLIGSLPCQGPALAAVLIHLAKSGLVVLFSHDLPRVAPTGSIVADGITYHAACLSARGASLLS